MNVQLLVPAAGLGRRLGAGQPKALIDFAGKPLIVHTLERFRGAGLLDAAIVLAPADYRDTFERVFARFFPSQSIEVVAGGDERQISVMRGLEALDPSTDIVAIHDAARPFVALSSITASMDTAAECGAATVAIPAVDTILECDDAGLLERTPDRSRLWHCQTPQTFRVSVIRRAHAAAREARRIQTDDATLVRDMGQEVKVVLGTSWNFKITSPSDLRLAQAIVEKGLATCGSA